MPVYFLVSMKNRGRPSQAIAEPSCRCAFAVHARAQPDLAQQRNGAGLEHAGANPLQHVARGSAAPARSVDAVAVQDMGQQKAGRSASDDGNLGAHNGLLIRSVAAVGKCFLPRTVMIHGAMFAHGAAAPFFASYSQKRTSSLPSGPHAGSGPLCLSRDTSAFHSRRARHRGPTGYVGGCGPRIPPAQHRARHNPAYAMPRSRGVFIALCAASASRRR